MFHFIEDIFRKKELDKNGLYVGEITEGANRHRALICLIRGFVIFLGTFGTLIGLLQAFNLPYNAPIVTVAFFITSFTTTNSSSMRDISHFSEDSRSGWCTSTCMQTPVTRPS